MYIDLLVKIKNAEAVEKYSIKTRHTKMDYAVAEVLNRFGFIKNIEVKGKSYKKIMEIDLNMDRPVRGMRLLSKPSIHRYSSYRDFHKVKSGHGLLVVSTSKGIMTAEDAKKEKVGGEMLFEIW
jgi:small subunit ribosomal protein S8